ncbi:clostripain-related cysteine peptidase [uncultured Methanoregula sp.]|uniref:clostripain-related cysteine peptidase n=1 Tax=uncultured Methanoregula sp. TaxID=1005933 RepID=UPI002AAB5847|nr:clostripain-related cysteine peptidase [uncultured Methanoregula sp.]
MDSRSYNFGRGLLCVAVIFSMMTALGGVAAAEASQNHAKTQILAYIVGSDLESDSGMATDDLKEIVSSIETADPAKLDVVVAFGGAKKDGWHGMRVATGAQLKEDAKDGVFGNYQYLYSDTSADMGSGLTLSRFIQETRSSRTSDRTILIIADHGNSYDGIGNDEVTGNQLKMGDIDSALSGSGIRYEPIMFDACLMASVEVGKTVQPYTGVMLGSEEIQRGSYEYSAIIDPLLENPDTDAQTIMKKVSDTYIDRKGSAKSAGKVKTMAIIDVSKMPQIRDSLDELGAKLVPIAETDQGLHDLKSAYNDAVRLGVTGGGKPTSVDLVTLLQNIETKRPELSPEVQKTIGLVKSAVIYERHNEYSPVVYGISIATPDAMDLAKYHSYGDAVKVGPHWDEFFTKMIEVSQKSEPDASSTAKAVVAEQPAALSSGNDDESASSDKMKTDIDKKSVSLGRLRFTGKGNGTYDLNDPYHAASVYAVYYLVNGSHALEIGAVPVNAGTDRLYKIPAWDGRWYYFPEKPAAPGSLWDQILNLFAGTEKKTAPFFVDMQYDDITAGGFDEYNSWIRMQESGEITDATLVTYVRGNQSSIETILTPYSTTKDGSELFSRGVDHFGNGTLVTSYTTGFDLKTRTPGEFTLSTCTASPDMTMKYTLLPDGTYAAGLLAYYDEDNEVVADGFRIITIRNGAIVSSTTGYPAPGLT